MTAATIVAAVQVQSWQHNATSNDFMSSVVHVDTEGDSSDDSKGEFSAIRQSILTLNRSLRELHSSQQEQEQKQKQQVLLYKE